MPATINYFPVPSGSDPFNSAAEAFLRAKVPQLTAFAHQKLGQYNLGGITLATGFANTANMVGGGLTTANGTINSFGGDIYEDAKTYFGFVFRGILAVTSTTRSATLGLSNQAGTNLMGVRSEFDVDATHYLLRAAGSNSIGTVVNDGLIHTFAVSGDGTTIMLWIDGVSYGGAGIAQSGMTTEPLGGMLQNTISPNVKASRFSYGWVDP